MFRTGMYFFVQITWDRMKIIIKISIDKWQEQTYNTKRN